MFKRIFSCFTLQKEKRQEIIERKEDELETECTICMEDIETDDFVTKCHHRFHKKCLNKWISLYSNKECPNCRKELGLYVFETKRERQKRIKKEKHLEQIKKEEEELQRMVERIEQNRIEMMIRESLRLEREYMRRNRTKLFKFMDILEALNIIPNEDIDYTKVDFINCVSLKKFIKQYQQREGQPTGVCHFCNKTTYKRYTIDYRRIYHRECHNLFICSRNHRH